MKLRELYFACSSNHFSALTRVLPHLLRKACLGENDPEAMRQTWIYIKSRLNAAFLPHDFLQDESFVT